MANNIKITQSETEPKTSDLWLTSDDKLKKFTGNGWEEISTVKDADFRDKLIDSIGEGGATGYNYIYWDAFTFSTWPSNINDVCIIFHEAMANYDKRQGSGIDGISFYKEGKTNGGIIRFINEYGNDETLTFLAIPNISLTISSAKVTASNSFAVIKIEYIKDENTSYISFKVGYNASTADLNGTYKVTKNADGTYTVEKQ